MPKPRNYKLRILYVYDILKRMTDSEQGIAMREILNQLQIRGIEAERKAVYDDISLLCSEYGADIVCLSAGGRSEYRLLSRDFELPELKLLVDAVQSSRFITEKKTGELISKLESLASVRGARELQGQVFVRGRIKTMNETIYYNVDAVNEGIVKNRKISFHYFEWSPDRRKKLRHGGRLYTVSPLALSWDSENYYLIAFDAESGLIKHYRVDKMLDISCTDEPREGVSQLDGFDAALYGRGIFGMFGGRERTVTFRCENTLAGAVIDRFGQDIITVVQGDAFTFTADVQVSPQFFAWLCGLGRGIEIEFPEDVRCDFREYLRKILEKYDG